MLFFVLTNGVYNEHLLKDINPLSGFTYLK